MPVCTIASRRQLPQARVLLATLAQHLPDADRTLVLLDPADDTEREVLAEATGASVLGYDELTGAAAGRLAAVNPPAALPAATMPWLLRRLLDEGAERVVSVAPEVRVLGPLEELLGLMTQRSVVLVPRVVAGTADGSAFGDSESAGAFHPGLFGVSRGDGADTLLGSWPEYFAPGADGSGRESVRAWFDAIPALVDDAAALHHPGYGLDAAAVGAAVAAGGALADDDARLVVGGQPARTFDFAVFDPRRPDTLLADGTALELSAAPALARLCRLHADELLAAGYGEESECGEPYVELGGGVRLTPLLRRMALDWINVEPSSDDVFTAAGREAFFAYLNQPAARGRAQSLTRLHLEIYDSRADLQTAYPHLDGPDGAGYAGWLCLHGAQEEGLAPPLLPPAPEHLYREARAPDLPPLWGVNVAGFLTAELGVGEAARLLISGLDARGVPLLPIQGQLVAPSRQAANFAYLSPDEAAYPITIVCMNGDTIPAFAREVGRDFFDRRYTVALWWWELAAFPDSWNAAFEFVDEVWVASKFIYDAVAPASPVPVLQVTLPVEQPRLAVAGRVELGLPEDGFVFMFVYDYHSSAARKNPLGVIEAFKRAFAPGSGAKLVLKSINGSRIPHEHDRVLLAAAGHPDITVIDAYVSAAEKNAMIAACDCYVSLHRAEGFGLTLAEAMLLSKPVIATRYGGTLEFTDDSNCYLVDWSPGEVGQGALAYPADAVWAEPDLDQAAQYMRRVVAHPDEASRRGALARQRMLAEHSPAVAGASMESRLRLIYDRLVEGGARTPNLAHVPELDIGDLPALIDEEPEIVGRGPVGWLKRAFKPLLAAITRPVVSRQRKVDRRVWEGLLQIDMRMRELIDGLQDRQRAERAESLASVRALRAEIAELRASLETLSEQRAREQEASQRWQQARRDAS